MIMSPFKLLTTLSSQLKFKPHTLFVLLSSYAFLLGFLPILADTTAPLAIAVSGWFALLLALQMVLLGGLSGRGADGVARWLAAVLLVANLVAFFLSFFSEFLSLPGWQKGLLFVAVVAVARLLLGAAAARPQLARLVMLIVALNMAVAVGSEVTGSTGHVGHGPVTSPAQAGALTDLPRYSRIHFTDTPNIHLIAIDSLLPDALAVKHMGIHARYQAAFEEAGAVVVPNLFSSQSPTSQSLASLGRFADPDYSGHHAFSGRVLQPLYYLFRHNGYRITAGYSSGKKSFGAQGPYVDEYVNTSGLARIFSESALCKHQSERGRTFQLYGLCRWVTPLERHNQRGWGGQVIEKIASKGGADGPWLTFHYIYRLLGHSAMDFQSDSDEDLAEYVTFFKKQQQTMMAPWVSELIAQVHATDPNAIVFVFGDHGPYLSRSITQEDNPTFYAQDRFGIFGAVLPTDQPCAAAEHLTHYAAPYATPARVLAGVVRCLAEEPQTVDQAMRFKERIDFSPFLYE